MVLFMVHSDVGPTIRSLEQHLEIPVGFPHAPIDIVIGHSVAQGSREHGEFSIFGNMPSGTGFEVQAA